MRMTLFKNTAVCVGKDKAEKNISQIRIIFNNGKRRIFKGDNMSISVDNENFDSEVLKAKGIVLADFYSDTCGPCKRVSPVLAEIEEDYGDKIKLAKINVNLDAKLARKYVVGAVPTIVFFKNGEETGRIVGAANKSEYSSAIENMM